MINLIAKSLWNRKGTALLTLFSIAISVALLIGVEQIRKGVRTSFSSAVSCFQRSAWWVSGSPLTIRTFRCYEWR